MKVLVVIDMQNDFITGSLGTPEAEAVVPRVTEKIRTWSEGPIYATQDTAEGGKMEGPGRAALTEGAGRNESVLYLTKATFGSRDLAEVLVQRRKEESIEEIVLIGLCTDICVISNALVLKAFLPEVTITVDAACCAGVNPDSHRNALDAMRMCQIGVVNG